MTKGNIESEYNEINQNGKDGWSKCYESVKERSEQEAREKKFSLDESNKANNRKLNRYRDVNPYDHSRIILKRGSIDYVNANLVKMEKANRKYILTQGPLQNTVGHFWLMVWEHNSKAILMLNKIIEKKQVKCYQYWPDSSKPDCVLNLTDVGLIVEYLESEEYNHYTKRIFRLTDTESTKSREILQFQYNTWPDFGIPSSPIAFLQFLKKVRDAGALNSDVGPCVVHCSAGIGRSGTFCLVDICLELVEKEGENKISVQEVLLELRRYRMGLIQTSDQLYFSYQAIIEGIKHYNKLDYNDYEEVAEIDIPPPLPPPRVASLNTKPLPTIPFSASAHELVGNVNHLIEPSAKNNNYESMDKLPPLPKQDSINESNSEEEEEDDSDDSDDSEEEIEENHSDENDEDTQTNKNHSTDDKSQNSTKATINSSFDADGTLPPSPNDKINKSNGIEFFDDNNKSPNSTELRKRKRMERNTSLAEQIKEIKRNQKKTEEDAVNAPKKRRV